MKIEDSFARGRGDAFLEDPSTLSSALVGELRSPLDPETPLWLARFFRFVDFSEEDMLKHIAFLDQSAFQAVILGLAKAGILTSSFLEKALQTSEHWFSILGLPSIYPYINENTETVIAEKMAEDKDPFYHNLHLEKEETVLAYSPLKFDLRSPAAQFFWASRGEALLWARRFCTCSSERRSLAESILLHWGESEDLPFLHEHLQRELSAPSPSWEDITDIIARFCELSFRPSLSVLEEIWENSFESASRALSLELMGEFAPERIVRSAVFDVSSCVRSQALECPQISYHKDLLERVTNDPFELEKLRSKAMDLMTQARKK